MSEWDKNWFGLFRDAKGEFHQLPLMTDFMDSNWASEIRSKAVKYLMEAPCVLAAASPPTKCELCWEKRQQAWRSDGVWLWPDSLGHMVQSHRVRVPARFEKHMESKLFVPPKELINCDVRSLPWPVV
jgi:hypothetical protein